MAKSLRGGKRKVRQPIVPPTPPLMLPAVPACQHRGEPVKVGPFEVLAGGTRYLLPQDVARADVVIPLQPQIVAALGQRVEVLACEWRDFGPPPVGFEAFLQGEVIRLLKEGKRLLVYCVGSHGRTGTFLASLIALIESECQDPVAAVRARHCNKAVETREQAGFVFGLKGQKLPEKYEREFAPKALIDQSFLFSGYGRSSHTQGG